MKSRGPEFFFASKYENSCFWSPCKGILKGVAGPGWCLGLAPGGAKNVTKSKIFEIFEKLYFRRKCMETVCRECLKRISCIFLLFCDIARGVWRLVGRPKGYPWAGWLRAGRLAAPKWEKIENFRNFQKVVFRWEMDGKVV